MCNLCKISHEDTRRFLLECSYLEDDREKHLSKLKQYTRTHLSENTFDRLKSEKLLLQFILDPSHTKCCDVVGRIIKEHLYDLEHITRTICYGLHRCRFVDVLQDIVGSYNVTPHKSLNNIAPKDVSKDNEADTCT